MIEVDVYAGEEARCRWCDGNSVSLAAGTRHDPRDRTLSAVIEL